MLLYDGATISAQMEGGGGAAIAARAAAALMLDAAIEKKASRSVPGNAGSPQRRRG